MDSRRSDKTPPAKRPRTTMMPQSNSESCAENAENIPVNHEREVVTPGAPGSVQSAFIDFLTADVKQSEALIAIQTEHMKANKTKLELLIKSMTSNEKVPQKDCQTDKESKESVIQELLDKKNREHQEIIQKMTTAHENAVETLRKEKDAEIQMIRKKLTLVKDEYAQYAKSSKIANEKLEKEKKEGLEREKKLQDLIKSTEFGNSAQKIKVQQLGAQVRQLERLHGLPEPKQEVSRIPSTPWIPSRILAHQTPPQQICVLSDSDKRVMINSGSGSAYIVKNPLINNAQRK